MYSVTVITSAEWMIIKYTGMLDSEWRLSLSAAIYAQKDRESLVFSGAIFFNILPLVSKNYEFTVGESAI